MNSLLNFVARSVRVWLSIFAIGKLYFLLLNTQHLSTDLKHFPQMWWNGLRLDFSMIGYILVIPSLLFLIEKAISIRLSRVLSIYHWIVVVICVVILAADPYFFLYWGQKANTSFTQFIGKENAGFASIEISHYLIAFTFIILMLSRFGLKWKALLAPPVNSSFISILLLMALAAGLIRGSFDKVPINVSSAFFSENNLYNNTAINAIWSAIASEADKQFNKSMVFFQDSAAQNLYDKINKPDSAIDCKKFLSINEETNVILIVLESFSAKTSQYLSGNKYACTPNLDRFMSEGITFTNAYASSFRSDKGLLALTYGVPATAYQTLTNYPEFLASKPNTFSQFPQRYHTGFYYGGNIEFANIKVLFKDADEVVRQDDYTSDNENAWGVHDEVVFNRFCSDFLKHEGPQFKMLFSLSSHEPFDVPGYKVKRDKYLNSISYTDSCLGVMIESIRKSNKWKNSLIIITADHGTIRPDYAAVFDTANFRIPLVFIGGVVSKDTVISSIVSQTNLPATLSVLLGDKNPYPQQTVFSNTNKAFYSYSDGLVMVAPNCVQRYDFGFKNYVGDKCLPPYERAYYQVSNKLFFTN